MDRYTKLLLSVIALALVWIAARPSVTPAYADAAPAATEVTCTFPDVVDFNLKEVGGSKINLTTARRAVSGGNDIRGIPIINLGR